MIPLRQLVMMAAIATFCQSCSRFTPKDTGDSIIKSLPEAYRTAPVTSQAQKGNPWWFAFDDAQLNMLQQRAFATNLSLMQAAARLEQAKQLAIQRGALLNPEITFEATASVSHREQGGSTSSSETYEIGPVCSYELDLWGRVQAARKAAALEVEATAADRDTAAMSLSAQVTLTYLQILAQEESISLLREQLDNNRDLLNLINIRYSNAQATALDVLQQQEVVASAEALIPPAVATRQQLQHALAHLLGEPPSAAISITPTSLPELPSQPATGIPADLLTQRPDVAAAKLRLIEADWQVSVAQADRLPAIRLSATAAYNSDAIAEIFDNWFARLAGNLAAPLFDGGRRRSEVKRTRAIVEERMATFRATLLTAIQEVEDALMLEAHQHETVDALERQLSAAQRVRDESLRRYLNGQLPFLNVVTADLSRQRLARENVLARYQLLVYRVSLYRALGGNWSQIIDTLNHSTPTKQETPSS